MPLMRLESTFGKTECEIAAADIIDQCVAAGTWRVWFQVPDAANGNQMGMVWLIWMQYMKPVPARSSCWMVNQSFIKKVMEKDEEARKLPKEEPDVVWQFDKPPAIGKIGTFR